MFEIGDYVVNATNGICRITEMVEMDLTGGKNPRLYYLLVPVEELSARVYVPAESAERRIRKAITKKDAIKIIDKVPEIGEITVHNEKERENRYKEAVKSCEPEQLVSILKTLHHRKQVRLSQGKKCTAVDERYMKLAEAHLYAELAFALGRQKDEMEDLIRGRVEELRSCEAV